MTSEDDLTRLRDLARAASENAYCRYGEFPVGAVVVAESGDEYVGCNVENASYGLTMCAERNAVFQMVSAGQQSVKAVVIYTPTPKPTAPCGACRQVINEFGPRARVVSFCSGEERLDMSVEELLPAAFGRHDLAE